jgi:hypothetical protein
VKRLVHCLKLDGAGCMSNPPYIIKFWQKSHNVNNIENYKNLAEQGLAELCRADN